MIKKIEREKRDSDIKLWFSQGMSQVDIANKLGITRQRVQQIESCLGISRERVYKKNEFTIKCSTCKKKFITNKKERKYCSRECFRKSRIQKLSKKEVEERNFIRREKNKQKAKDYYHNVFKKKKDWKDIVRLRNQKQNAT